jgi:hypothetical protein
MHTLMSMMTRNLAFMSREMLCSIADDDGGSFDGGGLYA